MNGVGGGWGDSDHRLIGGLLNPQSSVPGQARLHPGVTPAPHDQTEGQQFPCILQTFLKGNWFLDCSESYEYTVRTMA